MSNPNTLLSLLEKYRIEIPRLQRDYVQGRTNNEQAKTVRATLLKDIKNAVEGKAKPLDLNFVYGKTDEKVFLPVDGQQRLTTLFLLHLYAFAEDDEKTQLFQKFSYEARSTTRDFYLALIQYRKEIFTSKEKPSVFITDSAWFIDSWKYDPSVKSSLTVLDDIVSQGYSITNLRNKLEDYETPSVFFHFVELSDLGREDDLYIKINARGRSLTPFENFKSQFVTQCEKVSTKQLCLEIESALDIQWADYIWNQGREKDYDNYYLGFFQYVFLNHGLLKKAINQAITSNWIYSFDFSAITSSIFITIRNTLNYISSNPKSDASLITFELLKCKGEYPKLVLFHAICSYLGTENMPQNVDSDKFSAWLRVIRNLVNNSRIEELSQWSNAIKSINSLADNKDCIYNYLASCNKMELSGFDFEQFKEECLKSKIMIRGSEQFQAIIDAEKKLEYFNGQIRSAIFFSNLEKNNDISLFNKYVQKINVFFGASAPTEGDLLRRALCTFSDYRLSVGSYKTLCVDDPNENHKTPSMKRLFSNHGDTVKKILDLIDESKPLKPQLEKIISKATLQQSDWRYCIVEYPELLKHMKQYRMLDINTDTLMVPNLTSSGYNESIFLYTLKLALEKNKKYLSYYYEIGSNAERYLYIENTDLKITYINDEYIVRHKSNTWHSPHPDIIDQTVTYISNIYSEK